MKIFTLIAMALFSFFGIETQSQRFEREISEYLLEKRTVLERGGESPENIFVKYPFDVEKYNPDKLYYLARHHNWRLDFPDEAARMRAFERAAEKAKNLCQTKSLFCQEEILFKGMIHRKNYLRRQTLQKHAINSWRHVDREYRQAYAALYKNFLHWKKDSEFLKLKNDVGTNEARKWLETRFVNYLSYEEQKDLVDSFFQYYSETREQLGSDTPPFMMALPKPMPDDRPCRNIQTTTGPQFTAHESCEYPL